MASLKVSKVDKINDTYKLYLEVDEKSYGPITMNIDEVEENRMDDPLYQMAIMREFIQRRISE